MKKSLVLFFIIGLAFSGRAQTFKMLQSAGWYCIGSWQEGKHILMSNNQNSKYDSEVRFLRSGRLYRKGAAANDSLYTYEYKRGYIKIDRSKSDDGKTPEKAVSYYKLNTLEYGKSFELIPATEADFNRPAEQ